MAAGIGKHDGVAVWINTAAFLMSVCLGIWWVALPFIIRKDLGGTDTLVGICFAMHMGCYALGCLFAGAALHHWDTKRTALTGGGLMGVLGVAMLVVVHQSGAKVMGGAEAWILTGLMGGCGIVMSLFWPFVMGWISAGYEGGPLNRRLGAFNASWSCGVIVGPLVGGVLVEHSSVWPMALPLVILAASLMFLSLARSVEGAESNGEGDDSSALNGDVLDGEAANERQRKRRFLWVVRAALIGSSFCHGSVRTQLGLYFKYDLGYSESMFGATVMAMAIALFFVLMGAGRAAWWHFRTWPVMLAQVGLMVAMVLIIRGHELATFVIAMILLGGSGAFLYSSHLYYGVSGGLRRSQRTAIHETILSTGFFAGCLAGGVLSDRFGQLVPYQFGLGVLGVSLLVQGIIWARVARGNKDVLQDRQD